MCYLFCQSFWLTKYFHLSVGIFCFVLFSPIVASKIYDMNFINNNNIIIIDNILSEFVCVCTMLMRWIRFCSIVPFVWFHIFEQWGRSLSQLATSLLCIRHEYLSKNWCAFVIFFRLLLDSVFCLLLVAIVNSIFCFSVLAMVVHTYTICCWWGTSYNVLCTTVTFNLRSIG